MLARGHPGRRRSSRRPRRPATRHRCCSSPTSSTSKLMRKIRDRSTEAAAEADGQRLARRTRADAVIDRMLDEFDRAGPARRARASTTTRDGKRAGLWPGLRDAFPPSRTRRDLRSRISRSGCCSPRRSRRVKCLDEGVIESVADANIGSIMGIGFPAVDRRRAAVHQRLRGRPPRLRRACPRARRAPTASASSRPARSSSGRARRDLRGQDRRTRRRRRLSD